ncbi:gephyrin-like molybdotransferase Glp [Limnobacter sp.]|uniref:molybdopterin molybdotransferase MoeA n=1 Tax=Limnobacter sp. TaxID=2003368 RepID=UPI0035134121
MIALDDLLKQIWPLAKPVEETESLPLNQVHGRVLASPVLAGLNVPQHDNSGMDGYALCVADLAKAQAEGLPVSQRIPAGASPEPLVPGTLARIFTGAPIPPGADAVVMQEDTQVLSNGFVRLTGAINPGQFIRRAGEDIAHGQVVLAQGTVLGAVQVGLLASVGQAVAQVRRPLRVGVVVTGSELQHPGQPLQAGQIYNSNEFVWVGLLKAMGVEVHTLGIVPDNLQATCDAFASLAHCDAVISSGGVSVGEEDHVKPAIERVGSLDSWKVAMKPGKPLAFGRIHGELGHVCWFFGLPGNPVSSALAFKLVAKPFLGVLQGRPLADVDWRGRMAMATAGFEWTKPDTRREEFLRVRLQYKQGEPTLALHGNQSSGVLTSLDQSTGLARLQVGQVVKPGDRLNYISYRDLMA